MYEKLLVGMCGQCGILPEKNDHLDIYRKLILRNDIVNLKNYIESQLEENIKITGTTYEVFQMKMLCKLLSEVMCPWSTLGLVLAECTYDIKGSRDGYTRAGLKVVSEIIEHCQASLNYGN